MTITLIGEHNPYGLDPRYALFPAPAKSAGARLCRVLGLTRRGYLNLFARRNLLDTLKWSAPRARDAANEVLARVEDGDALVLLGARVSAAFGVEFAPLSLRHLDLVAGGGRAAAIAVRALVIPHPSGRSRLWNEPGMAERVRGAVEALLVEGA